MTTVPPPVTPTPQMPATAPAATAVTVLQVAATAAALPAGTVLEAVVVPTPPTIVAENAGKQVVTLRTPAGDITIRLPVQLPDNARVALEVLRGAAQTAQAPQINVRLVTVDNQPAAQVLAQLARQAVDARVPAPAPPQYIAPENPLLKAAMLPAGTAWVPTGPQPITTLGPISAFVTQGAPPATDTPIATPNQPAPAPPVTSAPAPLMATLTSGAELSVRITAAQLPATGAAATPLAPNAIALVNTPTPTPSVATPLTQPPATATGPSAPTQQAVAPPSPNIAASVSAPITPQPGLILANAHGLGAVTPQPPLTVQTPQTLATFTGTVISLSAAGAPIVETEAGQIQLNVRANLPTGTRITLEVAAMAEPRMANALPPTPVTSLPLGGVAGAMTGWPNLTEALSLLQRTDPQAAQQLAQTIPDGGPRSAAALMSFAQAMRSGDARQWPGDTNLRALERLGPRGAHLASQLSDEVAALSSRARDTGTEWRALPLPWNADGHIERIALITRREGDSEGDAQKKGSGGGTRFLINLDLTRLGALQLDGMFRKETRGFDMMIRTKAPLAEDIRHDLTGIFAASNAAMGLKGGLAFQVVKKFADPVGGPGGLDKPGLWA